MKPEYSESVKKKNNLGTVLKAADKFKSGVVNKKSAKEKPLEIHTDLKSVKKDAEGNTEKAAEKATERTIEENIEIVKKYLNTIIQAAKQTVDESREYVKVEKNLLINGEITEENIKIVEKYLKTVKQTAKQTVDESRKNDKVEKNLLINGETIELVALRITIFCNIILKAVKKNPVCNIQNLQKIFENSQEYKILEIIMTHYTNMNKTNEASEISKIDENKKIVVKVLQKSAAKAAENIIIKVPNEKAYDAINNIFTWFKECEITPESNIPVVNVSNKYKKYSNKNDLYNEKYKKYKAKYINLKQKLHI